MPQPVPVENVSVEPHRISIDSRNVLGQFRKGKQYTLAGQRTRIVFSSISRKTKKEMIK